MLSSIPSKNQSSHCDPLYRVTSLHYRLSRGRGVSRTVFTLFFVHKKTICPAISLAYSEAAFLFLSCRRDSGVLVTRHTATNPGGLRRHWDCWKRQNNFILFRGIEVGFSELLHDVQTHQPITATRHVLLSGWRAHYPPLSAPSLVWQVRHKV